MSDGTSLCKERWKKNYGKRSYHYGTVAVPQRQARWNNSCLLVIFLSTINAQCELLDVSQSLLGLFEVRVWLLIATNDILFLQTAPVILHTCQPPPCHTIIVWAHRIPMLFQQMHGLLQDKFCLICPFWRSCNVNGILHSGRSWQSNLRENAG